MIKLEEKVRLDPNETNVVAATRRNQKLISRNLLCLKCCIYSCLCADFSNRYLFYYYSHISELLSSNAASVVTIYIHLDYGNMQ